jgi:FixJ family two-component response regulator
MHSAGTAKPTKRGERQICIIDDDGSVRTALERLLLSAGFSARTFASARDFLLSSAALGPVCVISDVLMAGMSGLELSRKLRDDGVDAAFIFLTAHDTPEARRDAMESGGVAYYRKPVDDQALIDAIQWAMNCRGLPGRSVHMGPRSNGKATL